TSTCTSAKSTSAITAMRAESERQAEDAKKKPELTQLQVREMQTREYEATVKERILPVTVAVLQDQGYVIGDANAELGLLSAQMRLHEKNVDDSQTAFMKGFFGMGLVSEEKWSTILVNTTVTTFGDKVRVRFAGRLSAMGFGMSGSNTEEEQITDPEFYREFFTALEKGIFIEREGL
ncbi:MAG: hypothetical protein OXQ89_19555, partial [Rhodospirillaceae bacterium]|nr:hypothetical protein [Rhodospirillaceae bacterium]